jgi:hypothetical protein
LTLSGQLILPPQRTHGLLLSAQQRCACQMIDGPPHEMQKWKESFCSSRRIANQVESSDKLA